MILKHTAVAALAVTSTMVSASADVTILKKATQNMACSAGICAPTGHSNAFLNDQDLENLLATGDVEVDAYYYDRRHRLHDLHNLNIERCVVWSSSSTFTVKATSSINISKCIAVHGSGGLSLSLIPFFTGGGKVTFSSVSSSLSIANVPYGLVDSLPSLAAAIAANPDGSFALTNSYDASADGTYTSSPVSTPFLGNFEGLGNTILNISVSNTSACCVGGLFGTISSGSGVYNINLANETVYSSTGAGGLAYENFGTIYLSHVMGTVTGGGSGDIGGFLAENYGTVTYDYSTASVSVANGAGVDGINVGGLVGHNLGLTQFSFATGLVLAGDGAGNFGGLVGLDDGETNDSYATGGISGGTGLNIGGESGADNYASYSYTCYATGLVSGSNGSTVGGFIGFNNSPNTHDEYWDTTTSGTNVGVGFGNAGGITGLTTEQLQSGLPAGFSSSTWAENPNINGGLPYLIDNPPPK